MLLGLSLWSIWPISLVWLQLDFIQAQYHTLISHNNDPQTLRGPRGGLILTNDEDLSTVEINSAIFPGIQGGPLEHVVAAKAVSFKEVLDPAFQEYAANVIKQQAMVEVFLKDPDFRIISGGTENHLFLVGVTKVVENGKVAQNLLDEVNITLNKNSIPDTKPCHHSRPSGIRIGAAAITARGFGEEESRKMAELIIKNP